MTSAWWYTVTDGKGGEKMADEVSLSSFPSNRTEALAMLYLQNQDLKGKSPEELQTMYFEAYYAIQGDYRNKRNSGWLRDQRGRE